MHIHNFELNNSLVNQFISEIRDKEIQTDAFRFRKNIERVGEILSYELSQTLSYNDKEVKTSLGTKVISVLKDQPVLCAVLRAGLPLHQGLLNYFDAAESAFISAYRQHIDDSDKFEVIVNYQASPTLTDKVLVIADPMLATGKTLENVLKVLKENGVPKQIHIVSVIGSLEGVEHVSSVFPETTHLWIAAIDSKLNSRGYIIPGLGDAGDLSYGVKR